MVNDLLNPAGQDLYVVDDPVWGARVHGLQEEYIRSPHEFISLLLRGESNRNVAATDFNERSSRSHTIFRVIIQSQARMVSAGAGAGAAETVDGTLQQ